MYYIISETILNFLPESIAFLYFHNNFKQFGLATFVIEMIKIIGNSVILVFKPIINLTTYYDNLWRFGYNFTSLFELNYFIYIWICFQFIYI